MSIAQNFPNIKPSLMLSFADTKQLDNRVTFTRSTPAVYYDGKTTAMAEQNLLLYSKGFGAASSISITLTANASTGPDGTSVATSLIPNTSNARHIIFQYTATGTTGSNQPITSSAFIKANGYNFAQLGYFIDGSGAEASVIVDLTTGSITQVNGTLISYSSTSVGSGWYRVTITFQRGFSSGVGIIVAASNSGTPSLSDAGSPTFAGNGTSGIYYWGIQMEVRSSATALTSTTTQPITNYIPVLLTAGGNQARFDHNPTTGESLGLLIEEQRTNRILYSEQFDNAAWSLYGSTVTANAIVSPSGLQNGEKIVETTANDIHRISQGSISVTSGTAYTFTVYAKAGERTFIENRIYDGSTNAGIATFDLVNGTVSGVTGSASMTSVGNGWYRCVLTATATVTSSSALGLIYLKISSGLDSWAGNGFSGAFVWGAQLEAGAFATSYIATTSASATRTADAASMTGTNFSSWFNNGEGSMYLEHNIPSYGGGINFLGWALNTGTVSTNAINFFANYNSTGRVRTLGYNGTTLDIDTYSGTVLTANTFIKTSMAIKANDFALSVNGATVVTDTAAAVPPVNQLAIGSYGGGGNPLNGWIKKIAYYPIRVTNAQLQALTS